MAKYLTPTSYSVSGDGIDTSALSPLQLANVIARAEALVDRYCNLPSLAPVTVTGETHRWDNDYRRFYVNVHPMPVTAVTSFGVQVSANAADGSPLQATVNTRDIVVNNDGGYLEVVSYSYLTLAITTAQSLEVVALGISELLARVSYTAGWAFPVTGDLLTGVGDNQTYAALRPFWDATGVNVYKNGTLVNPSGYTLNATEGRVVFPTAGVSTDTITADYTYHVPDAVRAATVATTTALLGERALAQMGMTGLQSARAGRMYQAQRAQGETGMRLPDAALELLGPYRHLSLWGD